MSAVTRQLLRIATAGSVDDGKSTLIGRLLHDTDSLPLDHLEAVTDEEGVADLAALHRIALDHQHRAHGDRRMPDLDGDRRRRHQKNDQLRLLTRTLPLPDR